MLIKCNSVVMKDAFCENNQLIPWLIVSLGDYGFRIESSTIEILIRPDLIIDYDTNPIPSQRSSLRSQFRCYFDLFLIKVIYF